MVAVVVLFLVTTLWMLYNIGQAEIEKQKNLKDLESRFLLGSVWLWQYKSQTEEILKIIYEKAGETDEQFTKDYEKIVEAVDKKFKENADRYIQKLNETLGYKTEYQNWDGATKYIEKLARLQEHYESSRREAD